MILTPTTLSRVLRFCHLTTAPPPFPLSPPPIFRRVTAAVQQEPERRIDPNLTDSERQRQVTPRPLMGPVL